MARHKALHPGEILQRDFLEGLGVSQYRLAVDIEVPPRRINEIVRGLRGISADTALRFARLLVKRNAAGPLVLDGDELELVSVTVDGAKARHEVTPERLTIYDVPDRFTLETVSRIVPQKNTKLEGLYATKNGFV